MNNRDDNQGCLSGLLQLFLVKNVYDWCQRHFGTGRGCWGCGCGIVFFIIFIIIVFNILFGTNWTDFSF